MAESERWRERGEHVAVQAAGNALGTIIAALTLLLGGVLFGAIQDVSTEAILAAAGALVGALLTAGAGWWQATAVQRKVRRMTFTELEAELQRLQEEGERRLRGDRKREGDED